MIIYQQIIGTECRNENEEIINNNCVRHNVDIDTILKSYTGMLTNARHQYHVSKGVAQKVLMTAFNKLFLDRTNNEQSTEYMRSIKATRKICSCGISDQFWKRLLAKWSLMLNQIDVTPDVTRVTRAF